MFFRRHLCDLEWASSPSSPAEPGCGLGSSPRSVWLVLPPCCVLLEAICIYFAYIIIIIIGARLKGESATYRDRVPPTLSSLSP